MQCSFIIWWHLILHVSQESNLHLSGVVASEDITDVVSLYLHLHLQRSELEVRQRMGRGTISRDPLRMPHKIFEYHNSSWALPSSGNSTKSASGFSSKTRENCLLSGDQFVTIGVILRKILNPICAR